MTTTFDPSLAMTASGELPPDIRCSPSPPGGQGVIDRARDAVETAARSAERFVENRPVTVVLSAAGAGALLGWLLRR